ncbi:MAG: stalk domain-containing protein [Acidobacteriota bacterium]
MKKSLVILLSVLFLLSVVSPAFGAVKVEVGGKPYQPVVSPAFDKGVLFSPLTLIAKTLGADVSVTGKDITVTENVYALKMTLGSTQATFNNNAVTLPQAPKMVNGVIMVPFRAVYELFGAKLSYQPKTQVVSLNYSETRNDMTALQMLSESGNKQKEKKSYKMSCNMDMIMNMSDGKTKMGPLTTKATVDASIQLNPLAMYMKEIVNMVGLPTASKGPVTVEVVFNDKGMFMNMPEVGWLKMPFEGAELNKMIQESMEKDAATSTDEMIKSGAIISYDNDQVKDGKDYWVIDVTMGPGAMQEQMNKAMDMMPSLKKDPNFVRAQNAKMDLTYKMWINKQSTMIDYMTLNMVMSSSTVIKGKGTMFYNIVMKADYKIFDYDVPVTVPEIKDAKSFEDFLAESMTKAPK